MTTTNSTLQAHPGTTGLVPGVVWWSNLRAALSGEPVPEGSYLASDPNCPQDLLLELAHSDESLVRLWLAGNSSAALDVLDVLVDDPEDGIRRALALRRDLSPELYWRLFGTGGHIDAALALNPACPPTLLDELALQGGGMLTSVLGNPSIPTVWLRKAVRGRNYEGNCLAAVQNPSLPLDLLEKLKKSARDGREDAVRYLVAHPGCPADWFDEIAELAGDDLESAVAGNPSCPGAVLTQIYHKGRSTSRLSLAGNPSCPAELFYAMAEPDTAGNEYLDCIIAQNPACPVELLDLLAGSCHLRVLESVARNPSTLSGTLEKLQSEVVWDIRRYVLSRPPATQVMLLAERASQLGVLRVLPTSNLLPALPPVVAEAVVALGATSDLTIGELIEAAQLLVGC